MARIPSITVPIQAVACGAKTETTCVVKPTHFRLPAHLRSIDVWVELDFVVKVFVHIVNCMLTPAAIRE